jgi:hypothetical protein
MLEEIKEVNWNEDLLKKYDIKSIQYIREDNLYPVVYIKFNSGVDLNSNLHIFEINNLLLSIKSDSRDEKINQVIND